MSTTIHGPGAATPETPLVHSQPVEDVSDGAASEAVPQAEPELEAPLFDAQPWTLTPPLFDDLAANLIRIGFSGTIDLDPTLEEDLALYERLSLGRPVSLTVHGYTSAKQGSYKEDAEGEVTVTGKAVVKVHSVDLIEQ